MIDSESTVVAGARRAVPGDARSRSRCRWHRQVIEWRSGAGRRASAAAGIRNRSSRTSALSTTLAERLVPPPPAAEPVPPPAPVAARGGAALLLGLFALIAFAAFAGGATTPGARGLRGGRHRPAGARGRRAVGGPQRPALGGVAGGLGRRRAPRRAGRLVRAGHPLEPGARRLLERGQPRPGLRDRRRRRARRRDGRAAGGGPARRAPGSRSPRSSRSTRWRRRWRPGSSTRAATRRACTSRWRPSARWRRSARWPRRWPSACGRRRDPRRPGAAPGGGLAFAGRRRRAARRAGPDLVAHRHARPSPSARWWRSGPGAERLRALALLVVALAGAGAGARLRVVARGAHARGRDPRRPHRRRPDARAARRRRAPAGAPRRLRGAAGDAAPPAGARAPARPARLGRARRRRRRARGRGGGDARLGLGHVQGPGADLARPARAAHGHGLGQPLGAVGGSRRRMGRSPARRLGRGHASRSNHLRYRKDETPATQAFSLPMDLLAETGAIGLALALAALRLPRRGGRRPPARAAARRRSATSAARWPAPAPPRSSSRWWSRSGRSPRWRCRRSSCLAVVAARPRPGARGRPAAAAFADPEAEPGAGRRPWGRLALAGAAAGRRGRVGDPARLVAARWRRRRPRPRPTSARRARSSRRPPPTRAWPPT